MSAPRASNPKSRLISLRLTEDEDKRLSALVSKTGHSRSKIIRDAVKVYNPGKPREVKEA